MEHRAGVQRPAAVVGLITFSHIRAVRLVALSHFPSRRRTVLSTVMITTRRIGKEQPTPIATRRSAASLVRSSRPRPRPQQAAAVSLATKTVHPVLLLTQSLLLVLTLVATAALRLTTKSVVRVAALRAAPAVQARTAVLWPPSTKVPLAVVVPTTPRQPPVRTRPLPQVLLAALDLAGRLVALVVQQALLLELEPAPPLYQARAAVVVDCWACLRLLRPPEALAAQALSLGLTTLVARLTTRQLASVVLAVVVALIVQQVLIISPSMAAMAGPTAVAVAAVAAHAEL